MTRVALPSRTATVDGQGETRSGSCSVFSSHQLDVVETLCEDVVIVNRGRVVAEGAVQDLRAAVPRRYLDVTMADRGSDWVDALVGVEVVSRNGNRARLLLSDEIDLVGLARAASAAGRVIEFSLRPPNLSEVFVEAAGR